MNSWTYENSAKRKKKFQLVLQLSSVELLYLQRKKKGGMGGNKTRLCTKTQNTTVPTSSRDKNSKQLRTEVDFVFSTRRHTHTQAWWCKVSAKPQWGTGKKERSASSREQQSPAIAAFTTTLGTSKDATLSKSLRNVFAFFSF